MPAVFYHILHVSAIILLSGLAYGLCYAENKKPFNILYGITSFLILLGGFGLMAKLGYSFQNPPWITAKLLIWTALAVGVPIVVKRCELKPTQFLVTVSSLLILAVIFVYIRPF